MHNWYLLYTKPREESRALKNLRNQGFEVFLPFFKSLRLSRGQQVEHTEPLFPRYLFISLSDTLSNWSVIRSTRGISDFVRFSTLPAEVPENLVTDLKNQVNAEDIIDTTVTRNAVFSPGDPVEICAGSFVGWNAIVKEQDANHRVSLLIRMLGREQMIRLPINSVLSLQS